MLNASITRIAALGLLAGTFAGCSPAASAALSPTPYPFITATPQAQPVLSPTIAATTPPLPATTPIPTTGAPPPTGSPPAAPATPTLRAGVGCRYPPLGIFGPIYQSDPGLPPSLGCAAGRTSGERPQLWPVTVDFQIFERGHMLWVSNLGWNKGKSVFVLLDDNTFLRYDDTFDPATDQSSSPDIVPPAGLYQPVDALGKIWRTQPGLSTRIGYATAPSTRAATQMMMFEYGQMIDVPASRQVIVLKQGQPGSWSLHPENQ